MTRTGLTPEQMSALAVAAELDTAAREVLGTPAGDRLARRCAETLQWAALDPADLDSHLRLIAEAGRAAEPPDASAADPAENVAVRAPAGWQPGLATMPALLRAAWRRGLAGRQPVSARRDRSGRWVVDLAVPPVRRHGIVHRLGERVRPGDAPRVAAHLAERGEVLRQWLPHRGWAVGATAEPATDELTERLAARLGCEPWDLEVQIVWSPADDPSGGDAIEVAGVVVTRMPAMDAAKRRDTWLSLARDLLPLSGAGAGWWVDDEPHTGRLTLRRQTDPLGQVRPLPPPSELRATVRRIPLGVGVDGEEVGVGLIESNLLLGGIPGSGKSGSITTLLCGITSITNVALFGLDPKMVELAQWRPRASYVATKDDDAMRALGALVEEMDRRYTSLMETGLKKVTPEMLSPELPLIVLVIDELADLVSTGVTKEDKEADQGRATLIRRLISKGRAAGVVVIAATQKPQSDVVPTALRDLIAQRVGHATTNAAMTDTILGAGQSQLGGLCHEIPVKLKGVGYIIDETSRTPTRYRSYWVPDDEVAGRVAEVAHLRIDTPWLTVTEPPFPVDDDEGAGRARKPRRAAANHAAEGDDPWA